MEMDVAGLLIVGRNRIFAAAREIRCWRNFWSAHPQHRIGHHERPHSGVDRGQ